MSVLQQPYGTLGNLERLGIATKAIQALPVLTRRDGMKTASGLIEPFLRKRHLPPFVVEHDPDFDDFTAFTGSASPVWSLADAGPITPGGQARPMDIQIVFPVGGTVGAPGITYAANTEAGAFGTTVGAAQAFPTTGIVTIGGYPFQLQIGGTVNAGDSVVYSLRTDAGLTGAATMKCAWLLLNARGVDPKTLETLEKANAAADAWAKAVAEGGGDLGALVDATPTIQEGGSRFARTRAQRDPYGWVHRRRAFEAGGGFR